MTNRTVEFTFTINDWEHPDPKVAQVTLGLMPVEEATAQKVSEVMTDLIKKALPMWEERYKDKESYILLKARKQFTVVLAEIPTEKYKFWANISNDAHANIGIPLSPTTWKNLNIQEATVSTPSKPLTRIPSSVSAGMQQAALSSLPVKRTNPTRPVKATPVPPESQGLLSRICAVFAAIGRYIWNIFSSESDKSQYEPLLPKKTQQSRQTRTSPAVGFGTPYQTFSAPVAQPVAGIRPLRNGNNICFINAAFQALMNIPELIPVIINAHREKVIKDKERKEEIQALIVTDQLVIDEFQHELNVLTKDYTWYQHLLPDAKYSALVAQMHVHLSRLSKDREAISDLDKSITASRTLIEACEAYRDGAKDTVWLNALRGFDPTFGSYSQEDAHDLLLRILDPVLEPLRNGLDASGHKNIGIIPANIDPAVRATLSRFIPKIGEEKQLVRVVRDDDAEESRLIELAALDHHNVTPLPPLGLRKELVAGSSIQLAVPALSTSLQTLMTEQLKMHKPAEQDGTSVYVENGLRGDYQVTQKRIAIESVDTPPEFLTLHLKRFTSDAFGNIDKNTIQITLPPDNKLTLKIGEQDINYEIHSVLVHSGYSPRGGHYFSYVRKDGAWVEANDRHVAKLDELPASAQSDAYVIFLKKLP